MIKGEILKEQGVADEDAKAALKIKKDLMKIGKFIETVFPRSDISQIVHEAVSSKVPLHLISCLMGPEQTRVYLNAWFGDDKTKGSNKKDPLS